MLKVWFLIITFLTPENDIYNMLIPAPNPKNNTEESCMAYGLNAANDLKNKYPDLTVFFNCKSIDSEDIDKALPEKI